MVLQLAGDLGAGGLSAHERRWVLRQRADPDVRGRERPEGLRHRGVIELVEPLGTREVPEEVLAEVAQGRPGRELVHDQRGRGPREEDLSAVPRGHDASGAVDGRSVVVRPVAAAFTDVETHPHAQRPGLRPRRPSEGLLCAEAGGHAVARGLEDRHDAVSGGLHDLAACCADGLAQDAVVLGEGHAHRLRMALPEARAALHVGEEEGERPDAQEGGRFDGHVPGLSPCRGADAGRSPRPPW